MVTVFQPGGLSDPGPAAGAGIIGSGLSALSALERQKLANRNNLITSLLGGAVDVGGDILERRAENQQGRAALEFAIESGQLPGLVGKEIPEDLKIAPSSVNQLLGQASLSRLLGAQKNIAGIGKTASEAGIEAGGALIDRATTKTLQLTGGGAGQQPTVPQQPQAVPTVDPTPQQVSEGQFAIGVGQEDQLPPTSDGNLFFKRSEAQTRSAEAEARLKEIEARRKGKRFTQQELYDQGPDEQPLLLSYANPKNPQPFAIGGRIIKNSQEATDARRSYQEIKNELSPAGAAKRLTDFEQKRKRVTKLMGLLDRGQKLIGTNAATQVMNRIKTDPNYLLVTNDPEAALYRQILNEIDGITALQVTVDVQGTRPTDIDVERVALTLPKMLQSKAEWIAGTRSIVGDIGANLLDESVVLDRSGVMGAEGERIERLTGQQYEFGKNMGIGSTTQPLRAERIAGSAPQAQGLTPQEQGLTPQEQSLTLEELAELEELEEMERAGLFNGR